MSAADAQLWLLTVLPRARFWEGKGKGDEKREEGKWTDDSGWKEWDPTKFVGKVDASLCIFTTIICSLTHDSVCY